MGWSYEADGKIYESESEAYATGYPVRMIQTLPERSDEPCESFGTWQSNLDANHCYDTYSDSRSSLFYSKALVLWFCTGLICFFYGGWPAVGSFLLATGSFIVGCLFLLIELVIWIFQTIMSLIAEGGL